MSENINSIIFKKIKVLYELKEDFKTNIKLLHIFDSNIFLVTDDDNVYCFGSNDCGLLGFGHERRIDKFIINKDLSDKQIIQFNNSYFHTIARTIDGNIYCWGYNESGILGNGSKGRRIYKPELNKYLLNENIIDICCGFSHTLVLTSNGEVYAWGWNSRGQIGNNSRYVLMPFKLNSFDEEKVKAISCGLNHSMALTEKGHVFSWGTNYCGQLGIGNGVISNSPKKIKLDKNIIVDRISCGSNHSLLLSREKDIYVFGDNEYKQLGINTTSDKQLLPIKLDFSQKFIDISSHSYYNILCSLSDNGLYYVWGGFGEEGIINEPKETQFKSFHQVFAYYKGITYKTFNIDYELKFVDKNYFDKFEEKEIIVSGSFGIVSEVMNKNDGKIYAIKRIALNKTEIDSVPRELKIISKLNNECVVKFYNAWLEDNYMKGKSDNINFRKKDTLLHIQMEFCSKTLDEIIITLNRENEHLMIDYWISCELFIELIEGLNYLHKNKVIHKDLKPDNILITDGQNGKFLKLADFGLSVIHEFKDQLHSQDKGALKYMAPEVKNGRKYDTKADIYSAGIVLKDIFNLDEKLSREGIIDFFNIDSSILMDEKYSNLMELNEAMLIEEKSYYRPNCKQILSEKLNWILSSNEITTELEEKLKENKIEENFRDLFIRIRTSK